MLSLQTSQIYVDASMSAQFDQAISLAGFNALSVDLSIQEIGASTQVDVYIQESNDLENWEDVSGFSLSSSVVGHREGTASDLSMAFVRLRYEVDTDNGAVFALKANAAKL